jgi:hypothetical protein
VVQIKKIPGFPNYWITVNGDVYSDVSHKYLKPGYVGRDRGYASVVLSNKKGRRAKYAHRLVLETFVGPCPEGQEGRHLNGNSQDNRLENLCWGTSSDNAADSTKHGTFARGERSGRAKLTDSKVRMIRQLYNIGWCAQKRLGEMFDVGKANISYIVRRKTWKRI